jgi:predicted dehydrogenase
MNDAPHPPLRVGIAGAGSWAQQAHVPGFQQCPNVEIVAICDVDLVRAQQVAAKARIPHVYCTTAEMLTAHHLDIVSIVTPDDCHRGDAEAALASGAHILCEKPLATTVDDAHTLVVAAESAGVFTKVGFAMRYAPSMARLRDLVSTSTIGEPRLLQAFQQNGQFLDPTTPFHWKMDGARTGGGAIVEYGIHTIDLARWIMGEVASVSAASRTWTPRRPLPDGSSIANVDVDDSTAWLMEFASGAIGVCHAGWATVGRPPGLDIRVFGSAGAVRCRLSDDLPDAESLEIAGLDGHFQPVPVSELPSELAPEAEPWWSRFPARLIRSFVAEIGAAERSGPTFEDGLRAQQILDAILIANRERRWVNITPAVR